MPLLVDELGALVQPSLDEYALLTSDEQVLALMVATMARTQGMAELYRRDNPHLKREDGGMS